MIHAPAARTSPLAIRLATAHRQYHPRPLRRQKRHLLQHYTVSSEERTVKDAPLQQSNSRAHARESSDSQGVCFVNSALAPRKL